MSFGPNGDNRVCLLQKIMTRLQGTYFCISLARFALCFARQPNGPKCIQIVQDTPKYEFRVQWGGSGAFLRKIPTRLRGTNFCTSLARFALSFVTHPNYPKCFQIVQTHGIMRLGSNGVDRVHSLRNFLTRLHGMNFCTTLARFEPSFLRQPNGTKCTQIVWNTPKHEFRSQRRQSGMFVAKNYDATSWHDLLHQFGSFCTEFCKATERSQMHPNSKKHTIIWV